jgi:vitamin B12 transporter
LRVSWGESFNAPSLTDLYFPGYSNPSLRPELSTTLEVGLRQVLLRGRSEGDLDRALAEAEPAAGAEADLERVRRLASRLSRRGLDLTLEATWYDTDYEDLIAYDSAFMVPGNVARAEVRGFEGSLQARWAETLGADVNFTHLRARKWPAPGGPSAPLPRRPRNAFNLGVWGRLAGAFSWRLDLNSSSSSPESFDFVGADGLLRLGDRPGYTKVDLALSYSLSSRHKVHLKVENLLDAEYEEVKGYPAPGRLYLAGVTISL